MCPGQYFQNTVNNHARFNCATSHNQCRMFLVNIDSLPIKISRSQRIFATQIDATRGLRGVSLLRPLTTISRRLCKVRYGE